MVPKAAEPAIFFSALEAAAGAEPAFCFVPVVSVCCARAAVQAEVTNANTATLARIFLTDHLTCFWRQMLQTKNSLDFSGRPDKNGIA